MLSSSSKDSELRAHERDSDHLPLQEANPVVRFEAHPKNFSIRDHVLASRSKNIGASWPFPHQLLQICLKNGIRDLLPPFDRPSSLRSAHSLLKPASEVENISTSSAAQLARTVLVNGSAEVYQCLSDQYKVDNLVNDVCGIERSSLPVVAPALVKKPEEISETIPEEEIISSASMNSDIMASKVCPVCKAFSSTSNTTLNAHMDQCLSMESDSTLATEKNQKFKLIKPRKKRLMVDIYASAPICTLEDLDRRNGTSWAVDLNSVALTVESTNSEAKKPKLAESDARDDKNEGAVYVDSNGIKIRILSKINDAPEVLSREVSRTRRNIDDFHDGKIMSIKKDHFGDSSSKKMKLKLRNIKLRSLKLFENEAQASHHEETHIEEERSPVHSSGDLEKSLNCGSSTLKNWPSSKRSDLQKKSGKNDFHKIFEHLKPASDAPSASKSHFGKLSRLLESKAVNFPSSTVQNMENEDNSSRGFSSSEEFFTGSKLKSHTSPKPHQRLADNCHPLPKTKKMSTLSSSISSTIKTGKHRSLLRWTDKQISTSKMQVDQNMENADSNFIKQKSSVDEDQDRQVDSGDKTSVTMPIGSVEQVDKITADQFENGSVESQYKTTSVQEFSACLTSHEISLENPKRNFPLALNLLLPNQVNNLVSGRESLASPASSASTISPSSPKEYRSKASEIIPVSSPSTTRQDLIFPLPFMSEGNHETNQQVERTCCCSWQSTMAGNTIHRPLSNLYIRPGISCFYPNSNSRTDTSIAPSMESPTESILTKAFSDVSSSSPSCGTPTQSSSNSILRLMGKDVLVMNNEESTQIPKIHSPNVHGLPSPFSSVSSYASAPNRDTFSFAVRNQSPSIISLQERNLLPGFRQNINHKAYMTKEVIVIDDSDEVFEPRDAHTSPHTMLERPFSYFLPHTHLLPLDNGIRPSNPMNQGSSFRASHLPSPFVFQSPSATHLNSPFPFPQSLR